jgi:predicted nucleotidyltransferase
MVDQVSIYGSKARGDAGRNSDLEVLLIVHDDAAGRKRQLREVGYMLDPYGEVIPSIMAYTVQVWENRCRSGSRFNQAVEREKVRFL